MIPAEFTSHLMSVMAHEVKNQLQAIQAHVDVLKTKVPGPSDTWKKVHDLASHVERLSDFVRGIGRLQCPINFPPELMDLGASLRNVSRLMQPLYQRYHAEVHLDLSPHCCAIVGTDACLQRCWINFMLNALNAIHARKKRNGRLRVLLQPAAKGHSVVFEDNAGGLDEWQLAQFNSLVPASTQDGHRRGLGVAEARRVVAQHSGTVEYSNNAHGGCTVRIFLPHPTLLVHPMPGVA